MALVGARVTSRVKGKGKPMSLRRSHADAEQPQDPDDGTFTAKGKYQKLTVTPAVIRIERNGFWGKLFHPLNVTREIRIDCVSAVEYRNPGRFMVGFLRVVFSGERVGSSRSWPTPARVIFTRKQEPDFLKAKQLIDQYRTQQLR